ncbi:hypothetical protein HYH03_016323 [Edaphochlamys debaryana]|uniref:DNA replication licensing factor MCM4 n=1 Tax=Edaphochlamys debaryana TaxID=47281 RepID=A0A835XHU1_9CHLO|nr:hypothetical protein HYH03_016323 [Edaphochlamys debaryana]|eukprot:KAG2484937.1 hypothetical protein HYH03_016323 [Edaphochlamys debaryana]
MSANNSPGGSRGARPDAMDEDLPQQDAPQQQQEAANGAQPAPSAQTGSALHGTPARAPRPGAQAQGPGQAQQAPSGSNLQAGSQSQGGVNATPLPRGAGGAPRGEFAGGSNRRPQVRVAPAPSRSRQTGPEGEAAEAEGEELPPAADGTDDANVMLWGTNINSRQLRMQIESFVRNYRPAGANPESRPKYVQVIQETLEAGEVSVNIDTGDMRAPIPADSDCPDWGALYDTLVDFPREVACVLDAVVREVAVMDLGYLPDLDRVAAMDLCTLVCRPYNLAASKHIRDLDPSDIDKLVCIKGMVTRTSAVIPNLRYAAFVCAACSREVTAPNVNGRVEDPTKCPGCGKSWSMVLNHNLGAYSDKQLVKMQESPNDIPEGETPMAVTLYTYDTLVDVARPGDRVTITGVYRAAPIRANPRQTALHALFRTYVDVVHCHRDESRRLFSAAKPQEEEPSILSAPTTPAGSQGGSQPGTPRAEPAGTQGGAGTQGAGEEGAMGPIENITAEELAEVEAQIKELSADPRLVDRLVASLAPNIWEMEDIKKGVLCQLFGGVPKAFPGGKIRGELNVLLVGDPSVSKSQLLTYVHQLAPRGIYTSGKGSSAVGLTAYISKDPETRELVLESGALVLSDRGVCCIDEFDKMSDSARSMLHEAMEQQTVSVAKAGLISTLNARCSVLACANPIGSRYNPSMTIAENINLPPTLLTRFDLIYLILDRFEEARDRRLARHLVSLFHPGSTARGARGGAGAAGAAQPVPPGLLKKYIAYARARCAPKLTDEAAEELISRYQTLRRDGRERKAVCATPRQLESLIRLAESLARMRLADDVTRADVAEATRLWYGAFQGSAGGGDGRPDLDSLYTGVTAAQRATARELPDELRKVLGVMRMTHALAVDDLLREINSRLAAAGPDGPSADGPGAGPSGPKLSGPVTRSMLISALRQLDDLVAFDELTNTVRPLGRAAPAPLQPQAQAVAA